MKWTFYGSLYCGFGCPHISRRTLVATVRWVILCAFFPAANVLGQEGDGDDEGQPGLQYGLSADLRYDDNIYLAEAGAVDSTILEAVPFVRATLYNKGNTYQAGYRLNHAEYFDASDDSYDDHELLADINHRFTARQAVAVNAAYRLLTEERGTGFSEEPNPVVDGPDDYVQKEFGFKYLLGMPSADLRFELSAAREMLDYDSSYVGDTRDYQADTLGAQARYRLGGRSDLILEYVKLDVTYDNTPLDSDGQPLDLDSSEDQIMAGIGWEMTAKTRGEVKVGHSARDYSTEDFSTSDFHWEAEVEWRPKSYSGVTLRAARSSQETNGAGLFVNSKTYDIAWNHGWTGSLTSEIGGGVITDQYEASERTDDRVFMGAGLGYDYATWLNFMLGYRYQENDSNVILVNYEQNVLYLKVAVEL